MPKVRALLEEARHIANASHDRKTLAETEWNLAQITASSWNNPKSALPYGLSALELARATNDKELEARSLLAVGLIHFAEGNFLEILSYGCPGWLDVCWYGLLHLQFFLIAHPA